MIITLSINRLNRPTKRHRLTECMRNKTVHILGLPGSSVVKNPANAGGSGDVDFIPGLGRSLGGGNGNLLQYSCWNNPMDKGAW